MPTPARQPVQVALIFHCNQAVSTFAQVAAENCYRGLVRVLRRHPRSRFNFHWSGSLLTSLGWWYPDLVETIRREAARGRWEILASTYAQNVPYTRPADLPTAPAATLSSSPTTRTSSTRSTPRSGRATPAPFSTTSGASAARGPSAVCLPS